MDWSDEGDAGSASQLTADRSCMTHTGKNRKEASKLKSQVLTTKSITKIGVWNGRTHYSTGKLLQTIREMKRYKLHILGMSKVRWTSNGQLVSEGVTVLYSGNSTHKKGVGIMLDLQTAKALLTWEPVSDRIITARLSARHTSTTIVQVYAPTNNASNADKDNFYLQLQNVLDGIPNRDVKILMGDFNVQVRSDRNGWEDVLNNKAKGKKPITKKGF